MAGQGLSTTAVRRPHHTPPIRPRIRCTPPTPHPPHPRRSSEVPVAPPPPPRRRCRHRHPRRHAQRLRGVRALLHRSARRGRLRLPLDAGRVDRHHCPHRLAGRPQRRRRGQGPRPARGVHAQRRHQLGAGGVRRRRRRLLRGRRGRPRTHGLLARHHRLVRPHRRRCRPRRDLGPRRHRRGRVADRQGPVGDEPRGPRGRHHRSAVQQHCALLAAAGAHRRRARPGQGRRGDQPRPREDGRRLAGRPDRRRLGLGPDPERAARRRRHPHPVQRRHRRGRSPHLRPRHGGRGLRRAEPRVPASSGPRSRTTP